MKAIAGRCLCCRSSVGLHQCFPLHSFQAGESEIDMIFKIFQLLGTPDEMTWPGVNALPDFSGAFPKWPRQMLTKKCPALDSPGLDLLKVGLRCIIRGALTIFRSLGWFVLLKSDVCCANSCSSRTTQQPASQQRLPCSTRTLSASRSEGRNFQPE